MITWHEHKQQRYNTVMTTTAPSTNYLQQKDVLFYVIALFSSSSRPCLCHLIYFTLSYFLLTFSSLLMSLLCLSCLLFFFLFCLLSSRLPFPYFISKSYCSLLFCFFPSQVAVSGVADVRGRVQGNESEPDGAAEPTDGKGHRVVPQTLGQDVPAGGREALRAGLRLLSCSILYITSFI